MPSDKATIKHIHFETGFLGNSMQTLLTNNQLWKQWIEHYLEHEPKNIFVLEDNNQKVAGYIFGCLDDSHNKQKLHFVKQVFKNAVKSIMLPKKDREFWWSQVVSLINALTQESGELKFKAPPDAWHIHINLLPHTRGKGWGTKLLREFENCARVCGATAIHADTYQKKNAPASNFWEKFGYSIYSKVVTSHWKRQLPDEQIDLVCFHKNISKKYQSQSLKTNSLNWHAGCNKNARGVFQSAILSRAGRIFSLRTPRVLSSSMAFQ